MAIISMENNAQELILERINEVKKRLQQYDSSVLGVDLVSQSEALNFEIIGKWKLMSLHHFDLQLSEFSPEQRDRFKTLLKTETCNKGYYVIEFKAKNGKFLTSGDKSKNETCTEYYRKSTRTWITEFSLPNGKKQRLEKTLQNGMLEIVLEDENGLKMQLLFNRIGDDVSDEKAEIMAIERMKKLDEELAFLSGAMTTIVFLLIVNYL